MSNIPFSQRATFADDRQEEELELPDQELELTTASELDLAVEADYAKDDDDEEDSRKAASKVFSSPAAPLFYLSLTC